MEVDGPSNMQQCFRARQLTTKTTETLFALLSDPWTPHSRAPVEVLSTHLLHWMVLET